MKTKKSIAILSALLLSIILGAGSCGELDEIPTPIENPVTIEEHISNIVGQSEFQGETYAVTEEQADELARILNNAPKLLLTENDMFAFSGWNSTYLLTVDIWEERSYVINLNDYIYWESAKQVNTTSEWHALNPETVFEAVKLLIPELLYEMDSDYNDSEAIQDDYNAELITETQLFMSNTQNIIRHGDGYLVLFADTDRFSAIKYDSEGNFLWEQDYKQLNDSFYASNLIETNDGGFAFLYKQGYRGITTLLICDKDGQVMTQQKFGDAEYMSLVETDKGEFVLGGTTYDENSNDDFILVKYNPVTKAKTERTFGGSKTEEWLQIVYSSQEGIVVSGNTSSYDGDFVGEQGGIGETWNVLFAVDDDLNMKWQNRGLDNTSLEVVNNQVKILSCNYDNTDYKQFTVNNVKNGKITVEKTCELLFFSNITLLSDGGYFKSTYIRLGKSYLLIPTSASANFPIELERYDKNDRLLYRKNYERGAVIFSDGSIVVDKAIK